MDPAGTLASLPNVRISLLLLSDFFFFSINSILLLWRKYSQEGTVLDTQQREK